MTPPSPSSGGEPHRGRSPEHRDSRAAGISLPTAAAAEPILCGHCGRTASNGISCEGYCVADSGY